MSAWCFQCVRLQMPRTSVKESLTTTYSFLRNCQRPISVVSTSKYYSSKAPNSELIYVGKLSSQIRGVKMFSLVTSVSTLCAQPIIFEQAAKLGSKPLIVAVCGILGFFTFVTPVLLHLVTKKYATEVRYDEKTDKYLATTLSFLMLEKEIEFTPDDVHVPDVPGMFTSFTVKGVPIFVEPTAFSQPLHYGRIMGYDKPLDLKLGNVSSQEPSKK